MYISSFYGMINVIEQTFSYFKIFRNGSTMDRVSAVLYIIIYLSCSFFLFWSNLFSTSWVLKGLSLVLFLLVLLFILYFQTKIRRRENYYYRKNQSAEEVFLSNTIHKLSTNTIDKSYIPAIIKYYNWKIENEEVYKHSATKDYFFLVFIPIAISFFEHTSLIDYLIVLGVIGIIIAPPLMTIIFYISNRNYLKYKKIVYYLNLYLLIDNHCV